MNTVKNSAQSPFIFNLSEVLRTGETTFTTQTGPSPERIGPAMIAIDKGTEVTVEATISSLGEGIMVDATVNATLNGQCVRCLSSLNPDARIRITQVYALSDDFIGGEDADGDDDDIEVLTDDYVDILQAVIDEAGITLPFNPQCADECDTENVPEPDGLADGPIKADPRWAGLEKFL
ncbi:YceD family protein [Corynebacterium sp. ES2794-CONJ1]|uniref:YceD family protein n=1 Tax=unclassified Corynebacterium TaxID=2624378 RepID=UPI002167BC47|nr:MULTISPECIES: YceD family protein [unclassified Corynebacterium]MCS4489063.1 YceD family protein [Corynebacterium sp. ES2775-CONJ]MCS4490876.1 YceD family protein [Corynebacterium sp. ES2715-CONJ3]MCS4531241.1 YceD family protein [Corynebacterium sp. ES2730-CONJ]MCU9518610.1 YceD family protein [Corynebacterium sp. ES2794-CONJ1]